MKKSILLLVMLNVTLAQAQWTTNATNIYTNLGGNVGIGTTTPTSALDVYPTVTNKGARISINAIGDWGAFGGTTNNAVFGHTTSLAVSTGYAFMQSSTGITYVNSKSGQPINFRIANVDKMVLTSAGNFGVNTTAPATKFEVNGVARITTNSSGKLQLGALVTSTDNFGYLSSASQTNGTGLKFETTSGSGANTGAVRMTILTDGKVGIGTMTPTQALDVAGTVNATGLSLSGVAVTSSQWTTSGSNIYYNVAGSVGVGTTTPSASYKLDVNGALNATSLSVGGAPYVATQWTTSGSNIYYNVAGNVGIGSANPSSKLTVNGTVYAKEVKVDLSVPGPDYVFDKNYKLLSLEEIKAYVDANKHLPEVPSAAEMEKNGINLSEMNMLLLKKVEELTLHLIDSEERLKKMETCLSKMQASIPIKD